jgi:hypothetical protein
MKKQSAWRKAHGEFLCFAPDPRHALCAMLSALLLITACQQREKERKAEAVVDTMAVAPVPIAEQEIMEGEISLARNFYVVFDGSGSMRDRPDRDCGGSRVFPTKLEGAKWAVREFMKKVPPDVNLGLYVFDDRHRRKDDREVVSLAAGNHDAFLQAVEEIEAGGGTPLAEAIRFGSEALARQRQKQLEYGEFRLIVVTDGKAEGIPKAAEYATARGVPIYAIGLCVEEDHPLRQHAVSYRAADDFEELAEALEATMAEAESYDPTAFEALEAKH